MISAINDNDVLRKDYLILANNDNDYQNLITITELSEKDDTLEDIQQEANKSLENYSLKQQQSNTLGTTQYDQRFNSPLQQIYQTNLSQLILSTSQQVISYDIGQQANEFGTNPSQLISSTGEKVDRFENKVRQDANYDALREYLTIEFKSLIRCFHVILMIQGVKLNYLKILNVKFTS